MTQGMAERVFPSFDIDNFIVDGRSEHAAESAAASVWRLDPFTFFLPPVIKIQHGIRPVVHILIYPVLRSVVSRTKKERQPVERKRMVEKTQKILATTSLNSERLKLP
ncbi:hypothetical protein [Pantoea sp.]|uniref:hypothetical protein n=1 Tax=Pantoea sp. TaxID=69393 RepID=UPI00289BDCE6|nr:hypothetical protein [Pantoea sp.]